MPFFSSFFGCLRICSNTQRRWRSSTNHFLLFLGPGAVKQSDMASEPSDVLLLPNGMPWPRASARQILFILSGLLSRRTSFIACNFPSHLSLLSVCGWLRARMCVCGGEEGVRARLIYCAFNGVRIWNSMHFSPRPLRCGHAYSSCVEVFMRIYELPFIRSYQCWGLKVSPVAIFHPHFYTGVKRSAQSLTLTHPSVLGAKCPFTGSHLHVVGMLRFMSWT